MIERETKFLVHGESVFRRILKISALGPFRRTRRVRQRQWNQYWDTPDLRLKRGRAALKVRRVRARAEVIFKREIAFHTGVSERVEKSARLRVEGHHALRRALAREPFIEPVRQARRIIGSRPLEPVLTLRTDRQRLFFTCGRERMELDLDGVRVLRGRKIVGRYEEVELENLSSSAGKFRLARVAFEERFAGEVSFSRLPKYEIGLRFLRGRVPAGL